MDILNIYEIVDLQFGEIAYKFNNNTLPKFFSKYFTNLAQVHNYNTRSKSNKNLYVPRTNLNYGKLGVQFAAVKVWNDIPI